MKIAAALNQGKISSHFGHSREFMVAELSETHEILKKEKLTPPPHEPGSFPRWLADLGVSVVLTGGIGQRAIDLFNQSGIQVFGHLECALTPEEAIALYLNKKLSTNLSPCTHHGHDDHDHNCDHG
ncbi:MAG TPA: dinitrogenase iron-molybdenum cofactor biosynthesis protein [Spirochaetia bacterium]|nr:MAG: hypothetical protein A2Y41_09415 [Spirochaetes bacterium GWB1_36_13]HCL56632.1 dinitrogenase iron-molybdenum cofactor biosynthesis protein [Spirochaetia bacterium]